MVKMDTHFTLNEIYEKLGSSKHTLGLKGVIQRLEFERREEKSSLFELALSTSLSRK